MLPAGNSVIVTTVTNLSHESCNLHHTKNAFFVNIAQHRKLKKLAQIRVQVS